MTAPAGLAYDRIACSASLELGADGKPPTEFRIFAVGVNQTSKGDFLWDAEAAATTLARFEREGTDIMIDLEHDSIDETIRAQRADAGDARGYCRLALRAGELWAEAVRWNPDGLRRLGEKTQKYISPVALRDKKTSRVVGIHNLALVAQPATYGAQPLVAASKVHRLALTPAACNALISRVALTRVRKNMSPELLKKILAAIEAGEDKSGILAEIVAAMASGAPAAEETAPASALDDSAASAPKTPEEEAKALRAELAALKAKQSATEQTEVQKLRAEIDAINAERTKAEGAERADLATELIKLGVETPADVWQGDPKDRKVKARFTAEPIAEFRERVALRVKAGPLKGEILPPTGETETVALSKIEQDYCTKHGLTAEQFAAKKNTVTRKATT